MCILMPCDVKFMLNLWKFNQRHFSFYCDYVLFSYLPLLPVLDVLEGLAGVCAFEGPKNK